MPESGEDTDVECVLRSLANKRRRIVLRRLDRHSVLSLADLAEEVTVRERGDRIDEIPEDVVKTVYMDLYHCHLPILETANLASYVQERDLVVLTQRGSAVVGDRALSDLP